MTSGLPPCVPWFLGLLGRPSGPPPSSSLEASLTCLIEALALPQVPSFVAFGELDERGVLLETREAGALREALLSRPGTAPDVLVVEASRAAELRRGPRLPVRRILGVRSFQDTLTGLLGLLDPAREGTLWAEDLDAGWTVERLFTLALEHSSVPVGWPLLGALAVGLLRRGPRDRAFRWKAAFVRDVARRHAGESARLAWPEPEILEAFPSGVRLRLIAHVLQSASDGDPSRVQEYADRTARELEREDPMLSPGTLALRGALGRALAAIGHHDQAISHLTRAVLGWQRIHPPSASHALCELLRVLGMQHRLTDVLALQEQVTPFLAASPLSDSSSFVGLAWGRALQQCGQSAAAEQTLGDSALFRTAPAHVQTSRLRWLAAAQRHLGQAEKSALTMLELEALGDSDQLHLARIDQAIQESRHEDIDASARALLEATEGGEEARNLLTWLAPGQDARWALRQPKVLHRVGEEYRY